MNSDYYARNEKKKRIIGLMETGNWMKALTEFDDETDGYREPLLVWIRPSLELLLFIEKTLTSLGISKVLSIGCGCGFLERLLMKATKLEVSGLEVNSLWWDGPHSTPHFIPLNYTEPGGPIPDLDPESALLFCYFNNLEYFRDYLNHSESTVVILIGPIDGLRHCDPEPMGLKDHPEWDLFDVHNIRNTGEDLVAVYTKKKKYLETKKENNSL